mmetsp:Transcript_39285/g.85102  ORF Transcript_39285/g.85102 Transcript_39285/m.85102 type:complete len:122 (-) Transcript_39285:100-465(-)
MSHVGSCVTSRQGLTPLYESVGMSSCGSESDAACGGGQHPRYRSVGRATPQSYRSDRLKIDATLVPPRVTVRQGRTPLHVSAARGHVEMLLGAGDVHATDKLVGRRRPPHFRVFFRGIDAG